MRTRRLLRKRGSRVSGERVKAYLANKDKKRAEQTIVNAIHAARETGVQATTVTIGRELFRKLSREVTLREGSAAASAQYDRNKVTMLAPGVVVKLRVDQAADPWSIEIEGEKTVEGP